MSSVSQIDENEQLINGTISNFIKTYQVSRFLRVCRGEKAKGVPSLTIFTYLLCMVFSRCSMFMQMKTNTFKESYSKNTVYRFLNSSKTNWLRFTTLLSAEIITKFMKPLTSDDREDAFVIDDTLYTRAGVKKTELGSRVFDHVSMKMKTGFRLMALGWTDGNSFVPINSILLASNKAENVLGTQKTFDKRSIAGKRRKMAQTKGTEVIIDLLKAARNAGITAKYVMFDTWFSSPKTIIGIKKECELDTIAMIRKSSKINYIYKGEKQNIKQIFKAGRKRRGRSKWLLSIDVEMRATDSKNVEHTIPAKIVCLRNRSNKKDWIAIISTNTDLNETDIIRLYGKRFSIECFFKACKSHLRLGKECHGLSYDALTAHVALVFTRYMLLSVERRKSTDERSICEILYVLADELADITFNESLRLIVDAMLATMMEQFKLTDEQINEFVDQFMSRLPKHLQEPLGYLKEAA